MRKLLIFDFDGVIVDSLEPIWKYIKNLCQQKYHFHLASKKEFLSLFDGNFYTKLVDLGFPEENIKNLIKDFSEGLAIIYPSTNIFPGVTEVLKNLSHQNEMFVISSSISNLIEKRLKQSNINCFNDVIGADKELSKRIKIDELKKNNQGSELFLVSDTVGDILEAKESGILTIAVTWGYHSKEHLEGALPSFTIDKPEQIYKILKHSQLPV